MSLIKRYIDINFDVDARPLKRVPGTIVQGNNKVNVLRITYPNISSDHVVVALSQRADQITGSTFLNYSHENDCFELILHNWFTAVSGELQITFAVYSQTPEINEEGIITTETDTLRKVYLNVEESISADLPAPEDESIFLDVAVMVKTYDARIEELLYRVENLENFNGVYITSYDELDNYTTPGIYNFNFRDSKVFNMFVVKQTNDIIVQIRSSNDGYYLRKYFISEDNYSDWSYFEYSVNGSVTQWQSDIYYHKGEMVRQNEVYVCINDCRGYDPEEDDENNPLYWIKFEPENYILKEEGKGLSTNDLTNELLAKLNSLKNYDDTTIKNKITVIEKILVSDNVNLDTLQEIVDMLESNEGDINAIFTAIAKKVDKDGLKTINGESIVGSGNIEVKGGSGNAIDLGDYLKNGDKKPDTNISAVYNSFNLYDSTYTSGLNIHKDLTGIFGSGNTIYLSNEGVKINGKSFNELYNKVQEIYGEKINYIHDNDVKHTKIVPTNVQKYASINKLGGMTNLIDDSIQENKVTAIKINNKNLLRGKIFYTSGTTYTKEVDDEGWITLNFDASSSSSSGTNITLVATQSTPMIQKGEVATARIIFKDGINHNVGSIVFGQGSTSGDSTTRFTSLGYNENELYSYRIYTGMANYNIDQVYIWLAHSYVTKVENVKFKVELIKGNGEPIYLLPIPEEIQNLEGYGLSIPNTEIKNEIDSEIDKLVVNCKKYIFTGTEKLTQTSTSSGKYRYWFDINDIKTSSASNVKCNAVLTGMDIKTADKIYLENTGFSVESSGKRICIYHPDYQTADSMKEFLKGKTLIYELSDTLYKSLPVYLDIIILVEPEQEIEFVNDNNEAVYNTIEYMEEN